MKPQDYFKLLDKVAEIRAPIDKMIRDAGKQARSCPLPENLRPATAVDIVAGAIIWYPDWQGCKWCVVEEVRIPDDAFKAFVADDGCRYGLDGAFVEACDY